MFSNSAKKDLQKFQYCFCKKKKLSVQRERVKKVIGESSRPYFSDFPLSLEV